MARLANSAVPKLRVLGKKDSWSKVNLGKYLSFKNGINAEKDAYGSGYKFINVLDIINNDYIEHDAIIGSVNVDEKTFLKNEVTFGDILFQRSSENREEAGQSSVFLDKENTATFGGFVIRGQALKDCDPMYLNYLLKSRLARREIIRKSGGSTRYNVGQDTLSSVEVFLTDCEEEQNEIANIISSIDKKISLLKEKHVLLVQYKKGVMQKLFSQEIRFKDENGDNLPDWERGTLGDLANKVSNKNRNEAVTAVLTNSAKSGIVNQTDYFKKDIANENNLGGYSIVEKDDFVYNPRISVLAPVGPIKRNHVGQGVMSPLYTVFRFSDKMILDYLELYFETTQWHRYMNSIANIGARHDRMNISMGDFFNLPIPIPSQGEMKKIVEFIRALNKKINAVGQQIENTQTFKKGLLQQMFVS